ncbi:hypothetical protein Tco_1420476 [Tanacetum coccineum]
MFQDFRYSDTAHLSRSVKVLKLKNFKKDATLKLFKNEVQDHYVKYKFKEQVQSKKSMITTTYSQEKDKSTSYRLRIKHSMLGQRRLEARSLIAGEERASLLKQVASLERSNARLRDTIMMKRARAYRMRFRSLETFAVRSLGFRP